MGLLKKNKISIFVQNCEDETENPFCLPRKYMSFTSG